MKGIFIILLLFFCKTLFASHIVGGDIYYEYISGSQYKINLTLYRDCFSTGAAYDDPLNLTIYNKDNIEIKTIGIPFPGSTNVALVFNNPCIIPPSDVCVEKATYSVILDLPPIVGGYTISYQRCCRGPNVMNLISPAETGLTLTTHIPGSETGNIINGSPYFNNYPPIIICNNDNLIFNHSATDPDGDSLVYSLVTPFAGATSGVPKPTTIPPPPYANVQWGSGFSFMNPLGPGATISIDSKTGVLSAQPFLQGLFVVGIRVQEYRNGVLVGQTVRDFLFRVISCNITLQSKIPNQVDMKYFISYCQGLKVNFDNTSFGASSYAWDFGVQGITSDVSTAFEPTYTYPSPGTYVVRLIANPGQPCTDTSYQTMILNEELSVSYTSNDSLCITGNSFNFDGTVVGTNSANYVWNFGPYASKQTASTLDVSNVSFSTPGFHVVTLNSTIGTCATGYKDSVYVFPKPTVSFQPPLNYLCEGLTTTLNNLSKDCDYYKWDFGVSNLSTDTSSLNSPTYTFPTPGTYKIKLVGGSMGVCKDSMFQFLTMNEILDVDFTSNDSMCVTGNSYDFIGSITGSSNTNFNWSFGNTATPSIATSLNVNGVHFNDPGLISVKLVGTFGTCKDSAIHSVYIFPEPIIDFIIQPGIQCVPFEANFFEKCISPSSLSYSWNFGNGQTSSLPNPSVIYPNVGIYDVTLSIHAEKGCKDTLHLTKIGLINVHPKPTSSFKVDKDEVDICHSTVEFIDASTGGKSYFYYFDGKEGSTVQNPEFTFKQSGVYYPIQYVTNEFQCVDSSIQKITVLPFTVYIPNSFTPDGNMYNNDFKPITYLPSTGWDFSIYNRWGELVFYTTDQSEGWDGTYKGKMAPDGTYTYKLHYESCEYSDGWQLETGHFTLIR